MTGRTWLFVVMVAFVFVFGPVIFHFVEHSMSGSESATFDNYALGNTTFYAS